MLGETSAKKEFFPLKIKIFFKDFFACNLTLPHLCMRDNSLGFEDCRLATHLLNSCIHFARTSSRRLHHCKDHMHMSMRHWRDTFRRRGASNFP